LFFGKHPLTSPFNDGLPRNAAMDDAEMTSNSLPDPTRGPGHAAGVSEDMIHRLVHGFYAKVRTDSTLGPIFDRVIGDNWDEHLAKMCDFWSSVVLTTARYKGAPMPAHVRLADVTPAHFELWLALFRQTARELCPPEAAALFVDRAERIAKSFQLGIAFHRGDNPAWRQHRI
jgi:hemoglobin